jgi:hypothetical protein
MGAYRDEQMFAEMDASAHGFKRGHDSAESITFRKVGEVVGLESAIVVDLTVQNIGSQLVALEALVESLPESVEAQRRRVELYGSEKFSDVAGIILEEQTPVNEEDDRGYFSTSDYRISLDDTTGEVQVEYDRYTPWEYFKKEPISGEWIEKRLAVLGVERDTDFCIAVAGSLTTQVMEESDA